MCDCLAAGLQPCVHGRVNGSAMVESVGECTATVCISEEEGFQQSVCEYLFVCECACVEQGQCASTGGVEGCGVVVVCSAVREVWILITKRSMVLWRRAEMDGV